MANYAVHVVSQLTERFWRGTVDAGSEEEAEVAGMRNWKRHHLTNDPTLLAAAKPIPPLSEKSGPGCEACGDCGCDPETEYGHGQIDACACDGCWDRRRPQLDAMNARVDVAAGKIPDSQLAAAARVARDPFDGLIVRRIA